MAKTNVQGTSLQGNIATAFNQTRLYKSIIVKLEAMNIRLKPSNPEDAFIFKNLYPLYLHDLSAFHEVKPNRYGILEPSNPT